MDLHSIMNDGTAPEKKTTHTSPPPPPPPSARSSAAQTTPSGPPSGIPAAIGAPLPTAQYYQPPTPVYDRTGPSIGQSAQSQSRGLTPLQTPGHGPGSAEGQYPFPQPHQQPVQSPMNAASGHAQHRAYEPHSATTPGARPSSHGYPYAHPSPSQYGPPSALAQQTTSQSPTPSSHHSQTPHSMRQSPLAQTAYQAPPYHAAAQHPLHHSQPSTPLGPPQVPRYPSYQRDGLSPFHQRSFSGASNGVMAGSPAQHQTSIGSLVDSPSRHPRPSPHGRTTSDYHSQSEREHSMSVSPKTKVPPRPPSLGSRHSSQQEVPSARNSLQSIPANSSVVPQSDTPSHMQPPAPGYAQTQHPHPASGVSEVPPQVISSMAASSASEHSLSTPNNNIPLQHQPQKMGMNHLLTPTQHASQAQNGAPPAQYGMQHQNNNGENFKPQEHVRLTGQALPDSIKSEGSFHASEDVAQSRAPLVQVPAHHDQRTSDHPTSGPSQEKASLKRQAESETPIEPPAKRQQRSGRLTERPPWANLERNNPRFGMVPNGSLKPAANRAPVTHTNGHGNGQSQGLQAKSASVEDAPWRQEPPLDNNLIKARKTFRGWERSMTWNTPQPAIVLAVADWLAASLTTYSQVGLNPNEGTLEIEGKIGTLLLVDKDERCNLPVLSATVLATEWADRNLRFESQMGEFEHKCMNDFLNAAIKESHAERGRERISYEHLRERDLSYTLSDAGYDALPPSLNQAIRRGHKKLRLRRTVDYNTRQQKALIVKVPLGNLHIFNPREPYDMRISINFECDFSRHPNPQALCKESLNGDPPEPPRDKDRLSYKHLGIYQADLTRVDTSGLSPKYELELEMAAEPLRMELSRTRDDPDHCYMDLVEGFMDNASLLMRQKRQPPQHAGRS